MKLPQTKRLIFLVGVVFLALAVFQFLSVPSQRQRIAAAESEFMVVRQKNERLSEILSEVKTIESNLEVVRQALPAADDVPALIMQLEQVAKQSGVGVQHLGFGGGEAETTPRASEASQEGEGVEGAVEKKISLTAVVTGSYGALQTFLRNLESTSRVVNVTNFRFSPGQQKGLPADGQEEGAALSVTLGLEAFYLAEVEEPAPETPLTLDTGSKEYIELIRKVKVLRVYRSEVE